MASAWIFLQHAECFASGFLISYLLCSRSPKNRVKNGENTRDDVDQTEIAVITKETVAKMTDLKKDYTCGRIADGKEEEQEEQEEQEKQEKQEKQNREEAKSEQGGQENEDKNKQQ